MSQEKLLRPLHRRRSKRKARAQVLNSAELCESLNIERRALEQHLKDTNIAYHVDSQGEIWASRPLQDTD